MRSCRVKSEAERVAPDEAATDPMPLQSSKASKEVGLPRESSGFQKKDLLDHPHVRPVILELVSAVQANDIVFASRSGDIPV